MTTHYNGWRDGNMIWLEHEGPAGAFRVFPGVYRDDSGNTTPAGIIHDQSVALRRIREACDLPDPSAAVDTIRGILGEGRRYVDK